MGGARLLKYETETFVLELLKSPQVLFSDVIKQDVAVIQFREHNGTNNVITSISVNKATNLVDVYNVPVNRL